MSVDDVSIYVNMEKSIKLVGADKKVKWSSTNRDIVSIIGTNGKNNNKAVIKSNGKTGKCEIIARYTGKKYICNVTVNDDAKLSRARLIKVNKKSNKISVKINLSNTTNQEMEYGMNYRLKIFKGGKWKKVSFKSDIETSVPDVAYILNAKSKNKVNYVIARGDEVDQLKKGMYRLEINCYDKKTYNYVYFNIE